MDPGVAQTLVIRTVALARVDVVQGTRKQGQNQRQNSKARCQ